MRTRRTSKGIASLLAALWFATLSGCGSADGSAVGGSSSDERDVAVLKVESPLRAPVWSPSEEAIFALGQDGQRLVKVDVSRGGFNPAAERPRAVASAEELDGIAGENLVLEKDREPDKIYMPVPDKDEVFVLEKDDLLEVRTFEAGGSPSRVALGRNSDVLFALSEDGSSVTAVDLIGAKEVVAEVRVRGDESSLIEAGAGEGFWVTGPNTVAFYEGPSFESAASLELEAAALAVETDEVRAYAAEAGPGRVVAVEPGEAGSLEVVAEAEVDGRVTHLAADEGRLYAVMPGEVLVLDPESLKTLETVDTGEALEQDEFSGLAVGEEHVYLTLERNPYVLLVEKP